MGRLPLATTVSTVNQVSSALAATHAKGIVDRDLKPENLFLLRVEGVTDFVKVVDFGISKVKASTEKLTRASVMMGTPAYMAPEQATGRVEDIDHPSHRSVGAGLGPRGTPPFSCSSPLW